MAEIEEVRDFIKSNEMNIFPKKVTLYQKKNIIRLIR